MQQCNTVIETHPWNFGEKSWKGVTQQRNTDFLTQISNFLKKVKKAEKADATTQHWFSHINILPPKSWVSFYTGVFSDATTQRRTWNIPKKFWREKLKRVDATMQHWFQNTYVDLLKKAENTDFPTKKLSFLVEVNQASISLVV